MLFIIPNICSFLAHHFIIPLQALRTAPSHPVWFIMRLRAMRIISQLSLILLSSSALQGTIPRHSGTTRYVTKRHRLSVTIMIAPVIVFSPSSHIRPTDSAAIFLLLFQALEVGSIPLFVRPSPDKDFLHCKNYLLCTLILCCCDLYLRSEWTHFFVKFEEER
jgi:hypothetical protein